MQQRSALLRGDIRETEKLLIFKDYRRASIASQISAAMSAPPKRFTSRMPVGEVTLISVR